MVSFDASTSSRRAATVLSTPNNLSEDYWSLRFSCDLFRPAKAANASTRIDIAIPNISFIRVQGGAPIQPADWVQLRALYAACHLLIRKTRDRVLENIKFIRGPATASFRTVLTPQFRRICSLEHGTTDTKLAVKTSTNAYISGTTKATQASAAT